MPSAAGAPFALTFAAIDESMAASTPVTATDEEAFPDKPRSGTAPEAGQHKGTAPADSGTAATLPTSIPPALHGSQESEPLPDVPASSDISASPAAALAPDERTTPPLLAQNPVASTASGTLTSAIRSGSLAPIPPSPRKAASTPLQSAAGADDPAGIPAAFARLAGHIEHKSATLATLAPASDSPRPAPEIMLTGSTDAGASPVNPPLALANASAPHSPQPAQPLAGSAAPNAPGTDAHAQHIAGQVTLWLHGKSHSAALSVDDDGQPLQVHVRLQGSETHIHFASAQLHTRQWLGETTEQLRQMLHSQGLHLSSVSVATGDTSSGSGHAPPHNAPHSKLPPANARAGAPQTAITAPGPQRHGSGVDFFA